MKQIKNWIKENKQYILIVLGVLIGVFIFMTLSINNVFADVGNNNTYDSSSGGITSDSSSDDASLLYIIMIILDLIDIIGPMPTFIILAVVLSIYLVLNIRKKNNPTLYTKANSRHHTSQTTPPPFRLGVSEEEIGRQIAINDPYFSKEDMKQKASECFVALQNAWTKKDWNKIRPFESDALFNMHKIQLEEFINSGATNIVERIAILNSELVSYKVKGDYEVLGIKLDTRMRDYIIDDETEEVLEGEKKRDFYSNYYMEFIRTVGVKTEKGKEISVTNCPNCGAPTAITSNGQCEYCQSVITSGNFSWVLNELVLWKDKFQSEM